MDFQKRVSKLENIVGGMEPVESRIVVISSLDEIEFNAKVDKYEREHPLESIGGPGPDRIFIRFRRPQTKGLKQV